MWKGRILRPDASGESCEKTAKFRLRFIRVRRKYVIYIVYSAAVFLVAGSRFTVGTLTLFLKLLNKITVPFVAYSNVLMRFKSAKVSVDRFDRVIRVEEGKAGFIN